MRSEFQTLSQRVQLTRPASSPAEVLNLILLGMIRHLGPTIVGHAKAVVHVEGGIVYASTTGVPPVVEVKTADTPVEVTDCLQVDVLCVFHGVTHKTLMRAWHEVCLLLIQDGFQVTALNVAQPSEKKLRSVSPARLGIVGSLLPSFLVLKPCCLIPVLGSFLGSSIGVLHIFAPLEPYRPLFILVSLIFLGFAFYQLYLRPPVFSSQTNSNSVLTSRVLFWLASSIFVVATLSPLLWPDAF